MSAATPANIIKLQRVLSLILFVCLLASVHGPPAAAPDACQAPARPDLPAARPPETHPPLHLHPMPVFGPPLDPQVHCGCHHLPCHGGKRLPLTDATAHISFHTLVKANQRTSFLYRFWLWLLFVRRWTTCFPNMTSATWMMSSLRKTRRRKRTRRKRRTKRREASTVKSNL